MKYTEEEKEHENIFTTSKAPISAFHRTKYDYQIELQDGTILQVVGKTPNWFHRIMIQLILGFKITKL